MSSFLSPSSSFTVDRAVSILGKVCLVAAVGLAHAIGNQAHKLSNQSLPVANIDTSEIAAGEKPKVGIESYSVITQRNIFGEKPATKTTAPVSTEPKTQLSLRLVGTNVTSDSNPFAIIENTGKKEQDVFELNGDIFGQAKLVEVAAEYVKIDYQGQIQTLQLEEGSSKDSSSPASPGEGTDQTEFTVAESELTEALGNLPRLLSQARAVPYFRNGQSVGMRLFAIRQGSLYEKLGLKNGDIIRSVNSNNVGDPAQALKIFEQLKDERAISLDLERNGESVGMKYSIR